jgi:hypothetical protein
MTPKQKLWLDSYLKHFNQGQASRDAGYGCKSEKAFRNVGYQNYVKLFPIIQQWFEDHGLSDDSLKNKLLAALDAMETKFFQHEGEVSDEREVIAWGPRLKALEMAMRAKDMFAAERLKIDAEVNVNVVKFSDKKADDGS